MNRPEQDIYVGTANWGKPYGMNQTKVEKREIVNILTMVHEHGLGIETAWDYDCMEYVKEFSFCAKPMIFKYDWDEQYREVVKIIGHRDFIFMKHHPPYNYAENKSVYSPDEIGGGALYMEIPYNIVDQRFNPAKLAGTGYKIARSVFIQGLAFKMPDFHGIPFYHLCWNFVRGNPNIDAIVVGVDSAAQLEDILSIPQYEIDYSRIGEDAWFRAY